MSTRMHRASHHSLQLPPEFEDLTGVVQNDLKVIVSILTETSHRSALAVPATGSTTAPDTLERTGRDDQREPGAALGRASLMNTPRSRDSGLFSLGAADVARGPRCDRLCRGHSHTRSLHRIISATSPGSRGRHRTRTLLLRPRRADSWRQTRVPAQGRLVLCSVIATSGRGIAITVATPSCTSPFATGPICSSSPRSTPTPWPSSRWVFATTFSRASIAPGIFQARDSGPGHEHAHVAQAGDSAPSRRNCCSITATCPRCPKDWSLETAPEHFARHAPNLILDSSAVQAACLRRHRHGRHGRGHDHCRIGSRVVGR